MDTELKKGELDSCTYGDNNDSKGIDKIFK